MGERIEALLRIPLAILYGVIVYALNLVAGVVIVIQFFYTLILGRRHKGMARFTNQYSSFLYHVNRYSNFATNEKPLFGGPGWEEVLPCDFDRENRRKKYEEIRDSFDDAL
ncbi:DUF4389 domain-containing protein [Thermococcus sp.]|uniref:DUF4389 domain-containing protein n=1 Tax=Thermococcus sp. TaxID=35749 RepID=UPI0025DFED64|nr:DUF4389 domain-containing protein [Thermococcus sp.]